MPFLTEVDSRAAIKGSRDPLGFGPVWTRFGRRVVGNLSTVSNSARGFTTLLLGYYFAEQVGERHGSDTESTLALFLKFEQLASYVRVHVNNDRDLRGIERVRKALSMGTKVVLAATSDAQILSNQKIYGLWGLYSVAARTSGLLASNELVLTPGAREFVEASYIRVLNGGGTREAQKIVDLLAQARAEVFLDGRHSSLTEALAGILDRKFTAVERQFYSHYLVDGGDTDPTSGEQRQLAALLLHLSANRPFGMDDLRAIIRTARRRGSDWEVLREDLERIENIEMVLVPASAAFAYLQGQHGQPLGKAVDGLRKCWGPSLKHLNPEAVGEALTILSDAYQDEHSARRLVDITTALKGGAYADVVRLLLEHNAQVMQSRLGASPWIVMARQKLDVRLRDEAAALPNKADLHIGWRSTFFINSLQSIQAQLMA